MEFVMLLYGISKIVSGIGQNQHFGELTKQSQFQFQASAYQKRVGSALNQSARSIRALGQSEAVVLARNSNDGRRFIRRSLHFGKTITAFCG